MKHEVVTPICEKCHQAMGYMSCLPAFQLQPAVYVYYCAACLSIQAIDAK